MIKKNLITIIALGLSICVLAGCASTNLATEIQDEIEIVTTDNRGSENDIHFEKRLSIKNCKYVNFELCSPDSGEYFIKIEGIGTVKEGEPGVVLIDYSSVITDEYQIYQVPLLNPSVSFIDTIKVYAVSAKNDDLIKGINVKIKSIIPTNEKLQNDPAVDRIVYKSNSSQGYKITTDVEEWPGINFGDIDINGYKYLNIELYSPNCKDGYVQIDSWGGDKLIADFIGPVPKEPVVFQARLSSNKGVLDNTLGFICLASSIFDGDKRVGGVDFYIKKVWATNKIQTPNANDNF